MAKGDLVGTLSLDDKFTKRMGAVAGTTKTIAAGIGGAFKAVTRRLFSLQGAIGAVVGGLAAKDLLNAFAIQEQAVTEFTSALDRGRKGGIGLSEELQDLAASLQAVGTKGDEAILMASKLAAQTEAIAEDQMPRAIETAVDLSAALGLDLNTAMRLVVNAANGMTSTFTRYGIKIDEATSKSGDFDQIMGVIEKSVKGADRALRSTTAGSLTALNNTFGDLKESLGEFIALTLNSGLTIFLESVIQDLDRLAKSFKGSSSAARTLADVAIAAMKGIGFAVAFLIDAGRGLSLMFDTARIKAAEMQLEIIKSAESNGLLSLAIGSVSKEMAKNFASIRKLKELGLTPVSAALQVQINLMQQQVIASNSQEKAVDKVAAAFARADAAIRLHRQEQDALGDQTNMLAMNFRVTREELERVGLAGALAGDFIEKGMRKGTTATKKQQTAVEELNAATANFAVQTLDSVLDAAFDGQIQNAKDLGKVVQEMLEELAKELIKIAIIRGVTAIAGGFSGGGETPTPVVGGAGGAIIAGGGSQSTAGLSMTKSTGGGFYGGAGLAGAAGGGILTQPTVIVGGERSRPEAIVPLQGGGIPVIEAGGGSRKRGDNFVFNISAADSQDVMRFFRRPEAREAIRSNVVEDVRTNGRFRREMGGGNS